MCYFSFCAKGDNGHHLPSMSPHHQGERHVEKRTERKGCAGVLYIDSQPRTCLTKFTKRFNAWTGAFGTITAAAAALMDSIKNASDCNWLRKLLAMAKSFAGIPFSMASVRPVSKAGMSHSLHRQQRVGERSEAPQHHRHRPRSKNAAAAAATHPQYVHSPVNTARCHVEKQQRIEP